MGNFPVINGPGTYLFGGHGSPVVPAREAATIPPPPTTTSGVMDPCVLVGSVLTVTGTVSISTYSTSTFAINILANLVCSIGLVSPAGGGPPG